MESVSLSLFGYTVVAVIIFAPLSVLGACLWARFGGQERGRVYFAELSAIVLAPVAFLLLASLRKELRIGFALDFWPVILFVICCYAFSAKMLFLNPRVGDDRRNAHIFFLVCVSAAIVTALTVPPWYE